MSIVRTAVRLISGESGLAVALCVIPVLLALGSLIGSASPSDATIDIVITERNELYINGQDTLVEELATHVDSTQPEPSVRIWVASGASPSRVRLVMAELSRTDATVITPQS